MDTTKAHATKEVLAAVNDAPKLLRTDRVSHSKNIMARGLAYVLAAGSIFLAQGEATKAIAQDTNCPPHISIVWNPSPSPTAAGYNLFYGTASKSYSSKINVGANTYWRLKGLAPNTTYYFVADTYDANGNESSFSSEVSFTTPGPVQLSPGPSGSPILSYQITNPGQYVEIQSEQSLGGTNCWQTVYCSPVGVGLVQYQDQSALTNQSMFYRVKVDGP